MDLQSVQFMVICLSLVSSVYYLFVQFVPPPRWDISVSKGCATGMLAVFALVSSAPFTLVLAFVLSTTSDVILSRSLSRENLVRVMMVQSSAFSVMSITLFGYWGGLASPVMAFLSLGLFIGAFTTMMWQTLSWMRYPVVAYGMLVVLLAIAGFGIDDTHRSVAIGVFLLLISTAVHGYEQFFMSQDHPMIRLVAIFIWSTYNLGLMFIALAFAGGA